MLDRGYGGAVSKIVNFYTVMNIADRLILYASIHHMKQLLRWLHGLIRPWFVCRAVDPPLVLRGGCGVESGKILGPF